MMSKELFVETIDIIKKHREKEDKFLEVLDILSPDTNNETFLFGEYENIVVTLLEQAMNDEQLISWWIYDLEFGTKNGIGSLFVDDNAVDLTTAEKLYDYLVKTR